MIKKFFLILIVVYQKTLSPNHGAVSYFTSTAKCRYYPTCSEYCYQAIDKYGAARGLALGFKRSARCHPWREGGYDPLL